jgi:outer membrane receptor protein involved in Fe transport
MQRRRDLTAAALAALAAAGGAHAQEAGREAGLEEITVTGSRIVRDGMQMPTPVTSVTAADLDMMAPGNIIDSLDYLPTFLLNDSPDTAASKSASAGASNVNLRGLGANRTLVLLNGRRMVPSNRLGAVDVNLFPDAVIERVDVTTGGASAVYGTDAVAGVVNFVLNTNLDGFRGHAQGGMTSRNDNENTEGSIAWGGDVGERGHLIASADYFTSNQIETLEGRDWFKGWGIVTNPAYNASNPATYPRDLILPNVVSTQYTFGGLISAPGSAAFPVASAVDRYQFLPDGTAVPFSSVGAIGAPAGGAQSITNGGDGIDPVTDRGGSLVPPVDRGSLFAYYDFDLTANTSLFVQALAGMNKVNSVGTLPLGCCSSWQGTIYRENPFLPANVRDALTAEGRPSFIFNRYHSTADIARDRFLTDNETRSLTFGADTEIQSGPLAGYTVNAYYQYGKNDNELVFKDFIRTDRLPEAMDVVTGPNGNPVCRASLFDPANYGNCVPIDLFGAGRATEEAIQYVTDGDQIVLAKTQQQVAEASFSGNVSDGWGAGAVSLAFGAAWREEEIEQTLGPPDLIALSSPGNDTNPACLMASAVPGVTPGCRGIRGVPSAFANVADVLIFTNISPIEGKYSVSEVFAETLLPIASGKKGVEQFDVSLAARYADYSGSGGIWAWKAGYDWRITPAVRLRSTASRDVRAATLSERFDRQGVGTTLQDPLFPLVQSFTSTQIIGGNPLLNPEEADTRTFGVVFTPQKLRGLALSADYYRIEIEGALAQVGVQNIVNGCYLQNNQDLCAKITRDASTNFITVVDNGFVNQDEAAVMGTDLEASYRFDLAGGGDLMIRMFASWLNENSVTIRGTPKRELDGETGDGSLPEFRTTTYLRYSKGRFGIFAQERYIASGTLDTDDIESVTISDNTVDSRFYTDLGVTWAGRGDAWSLYFNVQNLWDRDPPVAAAWAQFSGTRPTNDRLFDFFGRRYTLGVNFDF